MNARALCVALAMLSFVPSTARCFNLTDIGLFNGTSHRLQLLIDYSSGRRIDWSLAPGKSILMTRGFGEHITRVTVAGTARSYNVASLRVTRFGRDPNLWLHFTRDRIRVITGDDHRALEHAHQRPSQAMERTAR